jgi:hypothetical protein
MRQTHTDRGAVLPLVLIIIVVLGAVVAALATYATTTLRYGQTVEARNDRFAAADSAMREAIERLRIPNGNSPCLQLTGAEVRSYSFPELINGASATVDCRFSGAGLSAVGQWALILTGSETDGEALLSASQAGASDINPKEIGGPVYINRPDPLASMALNAVVRVVEGDVYFPGAGCPTEGTRVDLNTTRFEVTPAGRSGICIPPGDVTHVGGTSPKAPPAIPSAALAALNTAPDLDGDDASFPGCRVFEPGYYSSPPQLVAGPNYFKSGNYVFDDFELEIQKQGNNVPTVTFGYPDNGAGLAYKIPNPGCQDAIFADAPGPGEVPGATVYLDRAASLAVTDGSVEFMPRHQGNFDWVSIHALPTSTLRAGAETGPSASTPVLRVKQGAGKEIVVQGWLWAPRAWVNFANVTGESALVQLGGGSALGRVHLGANATAGEFEVSVTATPSRSSFYITARGVKDGESVITAVVDYAPPNQVAIRSRRVVN